MAAQAASGIAPAQLGFLAIFNPSLGNTDETIDDQIVYYASVSTQSRSQKKRRRTRSKPTEGISQDERHERLRQIGLAQGMASFSQGFADGASVDAIDTEKSRVVLHELEPGWWILASIDLTKVPLPPRLPTKSMDAQDEEKHEYSSREMKPSALLMADLLRAHNIFLMHHGSSLSALFVRTRRSKFVALLSRYWDLYLSTWNVLLHGNPAREIFGGINIAASGELGVGVGEEERGSGEREVLEGLVGRIEGLVDVVVAKFGEHDPETGSKEANENEVSPWLGTGKEPGHEDGVVFLGTGALSRKSLRDITHWTEDLYTWGEHAYGVIDSPTSIRQTRARTGSKNAGQERREPKGSDTRPDASEAAAEPWGRLQDQGNTEPSLETPEVGSNVEQDGKFNKMASYLKMGYGTYWTLPGTGTAASSEALSEPKEPTDHQKPKQPSPPQNERPSKPTRTPSFEAAGHYLIGLMGEIEEGSSDHCDSQESEDTEIEHNSRTVVRTLHVELESEATDRPESMVVKDFEHPASVLTQSQVMGNIVPGYNSHDLNKAKKLRVVVYVNRPFVFTFLFQLRTDSLALDSLYRSLHYQLAPLRKPLLSSTMYRPEQPSTGASTSDIFNLVWDPKALTLHSTIPNIPETYEPANSWPRVDAVSTHTHILQIHGATRSRTNELERTQKTVRGWWIVWTRLLHRREEACSSQNTNLGTIHESSSSTKSTAPSTRSENDDNTPTAVEKEIFLVRRASDHIGFRDRTNESTGKLAQGIGVDTRRYVEELLSLL